MAIATPIGYSALNVDTVAQYLAALPTIVGQLGGGRNDWTVREVGDGNLNVIFFVTGPMGGVAVKQALPYLRLVGESWPLPLSRAHFEHAALVIEGRYAPTHTPVIHHHDAVMALTVMELIHPHIIMRKGLSRGIRYPHFADHISEFLACTLFFTSDLAMTGTEKKTKVGEFCGNSLMCKLTEDLIFTDPYREALLNRWTSPQLDRVAASFRSDSLAKAAISELKAKFLTSTEAMIHGDLHTGSIMVTETETKVIDPEFAFYGPMGFDIGAVLGNLLLAYFAQAGHATPGDDRADYRDWILMQVEQIWTLFDAKFCSLWDGERKGDLYPADLFTDPNGRTKLAEIRDAYMSRLFSDSVGFAGVKMIRRILGLAHIEDLESIADADVRAACEHKALVLARDLLVNRARYRSIADVTMASRRALESPGL